jgi:outer membrane protein TolC
MVPNPGLTLGGGQSEPKFSAAMQLRLPIFGQRGVHVRAAELGVHVAANEAEWTRWRLRHEARIAYYSLARAEAEVAIAVDVEVLARRISAMAKERYDVGAGTRLDESQAELVHVRAQQDVSDRRAVARIARLDVAKLLGDSAVGEVADPLSTIGPTPELSELLGALSARHPELRTLAAEREAAHARARAARSELRPYPVFELGLELLDPTTCNLKLASNADGPYCVGPRGALGFDLPIFNWNGGPVERAESEARLAQTKAIAALVRIESAVRAAHEALLAARVRARFFETEYVPNARAVEAMAREGFASGKTGLLPLIEAERSVLEAQLGLTEALFSVQSARADLEEASGVALSAP